MIFLFLFSYYFEIWLWKWGAFTVETTVYRGRGTYPKCAPFNIQNHLQDSHSSHRSALHCIAFEYISNSHRIRRRKDVYVQMFVNEIERRSTCESGYFRINVRGCSLTIGFIRARLFVCLAFSYVISVNFYLCVGRQRTI